MSFEPKKFDQVYAEMEQQTRDQLPGMADFQVGSVMRTMYESFAYEIALLYEQMHQVYKAAYIDHAEGVHLDMLVAILGIKRNLPDYAEGEVTFKRDPGKEDIVIPAGTLVTTEDRKDAPKKSYKTLEDQSFVATATEQSVKVLAVERGESKVVAAEAIHIIPLPIPGIKSVINPAATRFTGKQAETDDDLRRRAKNALITSGKASLIAIENTLLSLPGIKEVKLIEHFDNEKYGVVDVFVDGTDLDRETRRQFLQGQIDQVRAAGVYIKLQPAVKIPLDGVFVIEANPQRAWSESDRQVLEKTVQEAIIHFLDQMRMGQTLQLNQLIRQILSVPDVSNLDRVQLSVGNPAQNYTIETRQIPRAPSEKFYANKITVTASPE
ncbi:MAG: baseplate J/gp47 family protein [Phormidium tanganyikae FI6-MK23]|jgi:uncharacterized phage protein gp47/JayE|nr:baseplate J/gp47 family protein [Phormidium tanganyikae FI6-MK23]